MSYNIHSTGGNMLNGNITQISPFSNKREKSLTLEETKFILSEMKNSLTINQNVSPVELLDQVFSACVNYVSGSTATTSYPVIEVNSVDKETQDWLNKISSDYHKKISESTDMGWAWLHPSGEIILKTSDPYKGSGEYKGD